MADIAQLGIAVDTSQTKIAARELDNLANAGGRAEASTKKLESTARKSMADIAAATQRSQQAMERMAAAQERQEKLTEQMARQMNEFARATNAGTGATNAMAQASNNAAQALGKQSAAARDAQASIGEMTGRLLATVAAVVSLNDAVSRMDAWTVMNNRLKLVTDTQSQFAQAQSNIIDIANSTQQPIAETAELYQRLASSQKTLGLSGTELAGIVKTISQSMVVGGTTAAGGAAALMQLGQAFNSGALRGEEFNSVMEQAPGLMQALAAGMGKTVGEMRALAEAGKITTQEIVKALQSQSDEVQSSFDKMTGTIGGAMNVAKNGLTELIGRMNDATGAGGVLSAAIIGVGENMGAVATGAATLAAVGLATWFTSAATAAGGFAVAATAVGTAMKGLMVSMGPAGWLILALGTAATAWQLFGDKAQTAGRQTETAADKASAAANKLVAGIVPAINTAIAAYDKMIEKQKQAAGTAATPIQQAAAGLKEADLNLQRLAQQAARAQQGIGEYAQMSAAERMKAAKAVTAELEKASLKRAELAKKEAEYNSGVVSAYVKGKERQTDASARLLQIEEAKGKRDAALAAAGNDRAQQEAVQAAYRVELAKIDESYSKKGASAKTAAARAVKAALKDETDALSDLAGLSSTYYKDLANYQKQRAKGSITEAQYVELVEKLIQKQPFAIKLAKEQAEAWKEQEKARKEAYDAIEKAYEDETKASERSAQQVTDRVAQIQIENEAADIAAATNVTLAQAIEQVMIARLEEQAVIARDEGKQEVLDALNAEIEARKQLASVTSQKEAREANAKAAKDAADEWQRTSDKIEDSLIDALMDGGKSGAEYIEGLFRSMVLRPVLQVIVSPVAGAVTSALGFSGSPTYGGGSGLSAINSGYKALTSGNGSLAFTDFGTYATNSVYSAGGALTNAGFTTLGSNVTSAANSLSKFSGEITTATNVLSYINAAKTFSEGKYGEAAGQAAGTYFGGPIGATIGGEVGKVVDKIFGWGDDETRYRYQTGGGDFEDKVSVAGVYGDIGMHDNGSKNIKAADFTETFQAIADLDAAIAATLSPDQNAQIKTALDNYVSGKNESTADYVADRMRIMADVIGGGVNELVDQFGGTSEELVGYLLRLTQAQPTIDALAFLGKSLGDTEAATLSAALALENMVGGQQNLLALTSSYYTEFYTEAERTAHATQALTEALASIGVDTMPATREAFRSLVEAQDLTTESGRATYAGLLGVSDAFAALVPATGVAANSIEAIDQEYQRLTNVTLTAEQAAQQRIGLEERLLQMQGDTATLRRRELASIDPTNQALQQHIWALEDEAEAAEKSAEITQEQFELENQLIQLQGDTAELRRRELEAIDPANRALQESIWALEDYNEAMARQAEITQRVSDLTGEYNQRFKSQSIGVQVTDIATEFVKGFDGAFNSERFTAIMSVLDGVGVAGSSAIAEIEQFTDWVLQSADATAEQKIATLNAANALYDLAQSSESIADAFAYTADDLKGLSDSIRVQIAQTTQYNNDYLSGVLNQAQQTTSDKPQALIDAEKNLAAAADALRRQIAGNEGNIEAGYTSIAATIGGLIDKFTPASLEEDIAAQEQVIRNNSYDALVALVAKEDDSIRRSLEALLPALKSIKDAEQSISSAQANYDKANSSLSAEMQKWSDSIAESQNTVAEVVGALVPLYQQQAGLNAELLRLNGDESGARSIERQEYLAQATAGLSEATALQVELLYDQNIALQDSIEIGRERVSLEERLFAATATTVEAAQAARDAIDPLNQTLYDEVVAAEAAKAIADQRIGLENQLLQLMGDTAELRRRELEALDPANRALQESIWALEDKAAADEKAKAIADQRIGLENQLLQLMGDTAELRRRELEALDETNRALQQHVWAVEDASTGIDNALSAVRRAVDQEKTLLQDASDARLDILQKELETAQQRAGIEQAAMQLLRNTAELRRRELEALNETNRALQQRVWAVEDASAGIDNALALLQRSISAEKDRINAAAQAQIDAINAAQDARQSAIDEAQKSVNDLQGLFDSITDTIKTLRGNVLTEQQNLDQARAYIAMSLSVARAGGDVNQERLQEAMQTVAGDTAQTYSTEAEYRYQQARQAAVLDELGGIVGGRIDPAKSQLEALNSANELAQDQIKAITESRDAQIKALDDQLKVAEEAVSVAKGIDISVIGVSDAITGLDKDIATYEMARDTLAREQLSTGYGTVVALERQIIQEEESTSSLLTALDEQYAAAQKQVDAINGVNTSVQGVQSAMGELASAINAQAAAQAQAAAAAQAQAAADQAQALARAASAAAAAAQAQAQAATTSASTPASTTFPLPSFDVGTNYVPRDMVAQIHEGEAIVPREFNPAIFNPGNASNGELVQLVAALTNEVKRLQSLVQEGNREQRRTANAVNGQSEAPMLVESV